MTVILAAMDSDGKVKIGGDSQASTGYDYSYKLDCPKVMKIGEYLMGGTGCAATLRRFQFGINYPKPPKRNIEKFMLLTFRDSVVKQLKGVTLCARTVILFVIHDKPFELMLTINDDNTTSALMYPSQLPVAVGCGFLSAIGAYKALVSMGAEDPIRKALEIAMEVSPGCGGVVTVVGKE